MVKSAYLKAAQIVFGFVTLGSVALLLLTPAVMKVWGSYAEPGTGGLPLPTPTPLRPPTPIIATSPANPPTPVITPYYQLATQVPPSGFRGGLPPEAPLQSPIVGQSAASLPISEETQEDELYAGIALIAPILYNLTTSVNMVVIATTGAIGFIIVTILRIKEDKRQERASELANMKLRLEIEKLERELRKRR